MHGPLSGCRARPQRHSRARDLAGAIADARRLRFRNSTRCSKGKGQGAGPYLVSIDDVGVATAFLAHDAAKLITSDTVFIDGGYHIID